MKSGDYAWIALAATVTAYEIGAARHHDGELLSEACDRYRVAHPVATYTAIVYLAAHLTRTWPQRADPLHRIARKIAR